MLKYQQLFSGKNSTLGLSEPKNAEFLDIFYYGYLKFHAQKFYSLGAWAVLHFTIHEQT